MVVASAPGKIHFIGEHAVVYGEPAILAAVGLRTTVDAKKSDMVECKDKRWNHDNRWSLGEVHEATRETMDIWNRCLNEKNFTQLLSHIQKNRYENYKKSVLGICLQKLGIEEGISVTIKSEVPTGAGMGGSSSLAVAIACATAAEYKKSVSPDEVNEVAYEMEKMIHGTPSGGDNSACCFGNLVWFQKNNPKNMIRPLGKEITQKFDNFVIINTGVPEKNTGELVQHVRNLDEHFRNPIISSIGKMSYSMLDCLKTGNTVHMKEIINKTHHGLSSLGVSTQKIDEIASSIAAAGGAAKLCGAGGGGIMLCYHENKQKMLDILSDYRMIPFEARLADAGVRLEI